LLPVSFVISQAGDLGITFYCGCTTPENSPTTLVQEIYNNIPFGIPDGHMFYCLLFYQQQKKYLSIQSVNWNKGGVQG
jgi:hypothetical protein